MNKYKETKQKLRDELYEEYPPILLEKWMEEDDTNTLEKMDMDNNNQSTYPAHKPNKIGYRMYLIYKRYLKQMYMKEQIKHHG